MKTDYTGSLKNELLNLETQDSGVVLDVGCGNAEFTSVLSQKFKRVVGIDPDEKRIDSASQEFVSSNIFLQVGRGESLGFSSNSFDTVVFCQSLHHVPPGHQSKALDEAWRVMKDHGQLLIIEPIYQKGSLEKIECLYHDEKEARYAARNAVVSLINDKFILFKQKEIRIEDTCSGFDDFYHHNIRKKSYVQWLDSLKPEVEEILHKCDKSPDDEFIMAYFATVWLLKKLAM